MWYFYLRRYRNMVLVGIFSFCLGCGITLSFLNIDCVGTVSTTPNNYVDKKIETCDYIGLVLSGPHNKDRREAIRHTWGKLMCNINLNDGRIQYKWNQSMSGKHTNCEIGVVKILFVIGIKGMSVKAVHRLRKEQNMNEDLLLLPDVIDSYQNLTMKMLHAMEWLSFNTINLRYVIKTDDDSFVRIDLIIKELENYAPFMDSPRIQDFVTFKKPLGTYKGLYWGYFNGHANVYITGKWQENGWFLCDKYLPYALGGGYVISRSIVDFLARNMDQLSIYSSEDVSMGVWTSALDAINRVHDIRFDTEWSSRGCLNNMLIRHKQSISAIYRLYKTLKEKSGKKLCLYESVSRKSYRYNWDSNPSKCCSYW